MFAVVEKEGTRWQDTGRFYANLCRAERRQWWSFTVRLPGDSPSNRIQITFPPSPSAEALCGHGTPPYGSMIILYGPLKAARSRTARPKNVRVIAAIQTIGVNKGGYAINQAPHEAVISGSTSQTTETAHFGNV